MNAQEKSSINSRLEDPAALGVKEDIFRLDDYQEIIRHGSISSLFQPIMDFETDSVVGYEALSRGPSDSPLHNPLILFDVARQAGTLDELDQLCRRIAIRTFVSSGLNGLLFLNAIPQGLMSKQYRAGLTLNALREFNLDAGRVVIELTEQHPTTDMQAMDSALEHYRGMGFQLAIDDLGAGYSSLKRWSELRPEFVKIDRHFIQNIDTDRAKQAFVHSIVTLADGLRCKLIAEGIESEAEFTVLEDLGIRYGQGFLFGRPAANPVRPPPIRRFDSPEPGASPEKPVGLTAQSSVYDLLIPALTMTAEKKLEDAYDSFMQDETLNAIAVLDNHVRPVGLLRRTRLLTTFSSQYGRSLHGHKPVTTLLDRGAVSVDVSWDLERISTLVARNMRKHIEAEFLVTSHGRYLGLVKVIDLLSKVTETRLRNAQHANPLTGLPGNVPIYERLDGAIHRKESIAVAYFDLDHFKPFNDVYGYARGDAVIRLVARILETHTSPDTDFLGHIGGDDFIIVFTRQDWIGQCNKILDTFDQQIKEHYRQDDYERGGIYALSRDGTKQFFPLVTLSVGVITPNMEQINSHGTISDMASASKHQAKNIPGSSLYVERRKSPGR